MPHFYGERVGDRVTIAGDDARHLAQSLRARPGEVIEVVEPGCLLQVRLLVVGRGEVIGEVVAERAHHPEPHLAVTIALAMLPAPALEDAFAHCTEAGAAGFLLLDADRSVSRSPSSAKRERWGRICREASMLAGRVVVPEVGGPVRLAAVLATPATMLLERSGRPLAEGRGGRGAILCIGPEGGWSEAELALAGPGRLFSLGPRNLRAETAAMTGLVTLLS